MIISSVILICINVPNKERSQTSYSLQPEYPIEEQICSLFPCMGMNFGKCCSRFPDSPPPEERSEVSDVQNLSTGKTEVFYQCCGTTVVQQSTFLSRSPWMIPFDIASFQEDSLSNLRTTLPRNITVDGRMYVLVGYTLYKEGLISLLQLCGEISGGFMMGSLKQTKHE